MTDRYENIRRALAMGPTPGPWADGPLYSVVTQDYCAGKTPVIALVELIPAKLDECMANKSLICACDPDTIAALLRERDELAKDAAKYRWGINNARWIRSEQEAYVAIPVAPDAALSCVAMRDAAIDAAMEGEKGQ
ncbi:MAG: hypothetical protein RBR77_04290 [Thauera sp.]|jgi:hypothetical protein|nr:hypothetical protein [Thauera sp.]